MEKTYLSSTPLEVTHRSLGRNGVWPMSAWQEPGPPRKEILLHASDSSRCPAEVADDEKDSILHFFCYIYRVRVSFTSYGVRASGPT